MGTKFHTCDMCYGCFKEGEGYIEKYDNGRHRNMCFQCEHNRELDWKYFLNMSDKCIHKGCDNKIVRPPNRFSV